MYKRCRTISVSAVPADVQQRFMKASSVMSCVHTWGYAFACLGALLALVIE